MEKTTSLFDPIHAHEIERTCWTSFIRCESAVVQLCRGQVTVAIIVAVMFMIFFKIIGLRYAVTLGVTAGIFKSGSLSW